MWGRQGGITCGAIDELRKSSKTIDERVIISFPRQKCRNCAFLRQNSVCLGSSLSMRSFAIEEPGSPVPALYATLVRIEMMSRMIPLFLFFCLVETILCGRLLVIPSTMFTFRPRVPGILSSPVHIQVTNSSIFVILLFFSISF